MEALSGVKGDNSVKIFGPDIDKLEELATKVKNDPAGDSRHRQRRRLPHSRAVAPGVPRRSGEVPEVGRDDGRRQQRRQQRPGGHGPCRPWSRARSCSTSPSAGPSGCANNETSILDIPVDIVNNQVVLNQGPGPRPSADAAHGHGRRPPPAGTPGRHVQPDQQHPAAAAARPGHAGGRRRLARPQRPVRARRRLRHLPRGRQAHDRHQVQRPRPRPGQRRGRGAEARPRTSSRSPYRAVWSGEFEQMEDAERPT